MARLKAAVLISGRGSNLEALITACIDPAFPAEIGLVIANRPGAAGLARAEGAGIPTQTIDHRAYEGRAPFESALDGALRAAGAEIVLLAGFMRILTAGFVDPWRDRLLNIHPSLLPSFPGLDTHARALAAGVRFAGCTVHFVRADLDAGPIIVQAAVPVRADDTPETLAARVLIEEHIIYPLALRLIAEGRVQVREEAVEIDGAAAPAEAMVNPKP
ncbi:MAG TPA: phosphoribosylglycinamide formyltransferase [Alphaproteobacteria bacterium]|nr:phosphoribosylglycinamide formyltransferase [Alphaproteobacteria bacterium]